MLRISTGSKQNMINKNCNFSKIKLLYLPAMRKLRSTSVLIVLTIVLFSCKKESKITYQTIAADSSYVSVTNASPSISNLLFYVDNQFIHVPDSPLSFGNTTFATYVNNPNQINQVTNQLPYVLIPTGYRQINFSSPLPDASFVLEGFFQSGGRYSIFITDTVVHGQAQSVLLQDNIGMGDTAHGQVRFLNLSPDSPPLDVYAFLDAGPNGSLVFSNCSYLPNDYNSLLAGESFITMPVGPYYFAATVAGTNNILLEGGLIIGPKSVITIYSKGFASGSGINAMGVGVISYQQ